MKEEAEFYLTLFSNDSKEKYSKNTLSNFTNYLHNPLTLEPQKWKVGVSEIFYNPFIPTHFKLSGKSAVVFTQAKLDIKSTFQNITSNGSNFLTDFLYVYCDIISPRIISSQCAKVLKIIPAKVYPEQTIRFGHIEYIPICDDYIRTISIKITNQEGEQIDFLESILPTMLTLHFKKIGI